MRYTKIAWTTVALGILLGSLSLPAQYEPAFPKEEFAARRAAFLQKIPDGVAIFLGAQSRSDTFAFRQNNNFHYFTGVETPDSLLVLDGMEKKSHLFLPLFTARERRSEGPQLEPGEKAEQLTGMDQVHALHEFIPFLAATLARRNLFTSKIIYVATWPEELPSPDFSFRQFLKSQQPWDNRLTREGYFLRWLQERFPLTTVKSYDPIVQAMRRVKTAREIEMMRRIGGITARGVNEAIRATRPGMYEYQVAAAADFVYASSGALRLAYADIVASGPNGNIWHYMANRRRMQAGETVLMDSGAEMNYYGADLTRTWPVSERFTPEQEKMYKCVLEASLSVIEAIRPGVTIKQLSELARKIFEKHGYGKYSTGGIGHYVGMAVHDVGDAEDPFVPGVIFNVEPILDIPEKQVHIRLEDTILVTESGRENLTRESPAQIEDLYRLHAEPSRLFAREGRP